MKALDKATEKFKDGRKNAEAFATACNSIKTQTESVARGAEKSASGMSKFAASIARIAKYRMIRAVIRGIVDAVKEGADNFYKFSQAAGAPFAAAMDKVKSSASIMTNQIGSAFGELYQNIAPIINSLIGLVTKFANVLTMIFAKLGGKSGWYKATEGAEALADAVGGAGQAAKEAMRYLAPFDELNRLPADNKTSSGGGASASNSGGGNYEWVPFEEYDIGDGMADFFAHIRDAFNDMSEWIQGVDWLHLASTIVTEVSDALSKVDWAGLTSAIAEFFGSAIGAVSGFLVGALADLVTWISDKIYDLFHNDDGTVKSGEEIVAGIWKGITQAIANAYSWIKTNIFDPFIDGFKKAFGIASPAQEMVGPGEMIAQGILAGIKKPFETIGEWIMDNVVNPVKEFFSGEQFDFEFPFKIDLSNFSIDNLKSFKSVWDKIKSHKATLTVKKTGTKDSVFTKIAGAWEKIFTKDASLNADLISNVDFDLLEKIKEAWGSLKKKTANLTANLKGTSSKTFTKVKDAWAGINTKASTLTATLVKSFNEDTLASIKESWSGLKSKTATFTAKLSATDTVKKFVTAWNNLKDKTLELKAQISETVTAAWNRAANAWNSNSVLSRLGTLPTLARGGVVDQATWIGNAIVGEAGREAIVPLERNTEWIGMVASGIIKQLNQSAAGQTDNTALADALYNAMSRALAENTDDRDIILDGNVVYNAMLNRNRREIFRSGRNPMMSAT